LSREKIHEAHFLDQKVVTEGTKLSRYWGKASPKTNRGRGRKERGEEPASTGKKSTITCPSSLFTGREETNFLCGDRQT